MAYCKHNVHGPPRPGPNGERAGTAWENREEMEVLIYSTKSAIGTTRPNERRSDWKWHVNEWHTNAPLKKWREINITSVTSIVAGVCLIVVVVAVIHYIHMVCTYLYSFGWVLRVIHRKPTTSYIQLNWKSSSPMLGTLLFPYLPRHPVVTRKILNGFLFVMLQCTLYKSRVLRCPTSTTLIVFITLVNVVAAI